MESLNRKPVERSDVMQLAMGLGLVTNVRLTESEYLPVPIAMGSEEICLPSDLLTGVSADELEPILAHELAHLSRRDPILQQIARVVSIVLWWQPLNRIIAIRLQSVAELRTDRLSSGIVGPTRLAHALVEFAHQKRSAQLAGMPAFPAGLLKERVAMLLHEAAPQSTLRVRIAVCGAIAVVALVFAPRFAVLRAQLPAMLKPLVVRASLMVPSAGISQDATKAQPTKVTRQPIPGETTPGENDVVAALTALLDDSEQHVRVAARESLHRIASEESRGALAKDRYAQIDSSKERK